MQGFSFGFSVSFETGSRQKTRLHEGLSFDNEGLGKSHPPATTSLVCSKRSSAWRRPGFSRIEKANRPHSKLSLYSRLGSGYGRQYSPGLEALANKGGEIQ
jgi:hypothetical protein